MFMSWTKENWLQCFAYLVSKQRKAALIKTIKVLDQDFNKRTLEKIKKESTHNFG